MKKLLFILILIGLFSTTNAQLNTESFHKIEQVTRVWETTGGIILVVGISTGNPILICTGVVFMTMPEFGLIRAKNGKWLWIDNHQTCYRKRR